jgi:hypothetical protein
VIRGTSEQVGLVEWMSGELDRFKKGQPSADPEYKFGAVPENVVHLYFASTPKDIQGFQQMATAVRTVADIRRVFTYNASMTMAVRGTAEQIALAGWLVKQLDQPAHPTSVYTFSGTNLVKIFYLPQTIADIDFQQTATTVRKDAQIRQTFTYSPTRAIVIRGEDNQIATATQILDGKLAKLQ